MKHFIEDILRMINHEFNTQRELSQLKGAQVPMQLTRKLNFIVDSFDVGSKLKFSYKRYMF